MTSSHAIDVTRFIDERPLRRYQYMLIGLCAFIAMLDGFDTQSIAFVAPAISAEWGLNVAAFGPIFGAGLFGLMIGAFAFGPFADRYGRKPALALSTAIFGCFALLTVTANSLESLLVFRLLTGIGLGGAMPNIIALTSEYSPARVRATMVSLMFCGFPLGAILGGLAAAKMIPALGWESIFYVGGIVPLLLVPVLLILLPESVRFLTAQGAQESEIIRILRRVDRSASIAPDQRFILPEEVVSGSSVVQLFREGRAPKTMLLWLVFFINLLVLYFLATWLPSVLRQAGMPLERAIIATAALYVGGIIGSLVFARYIDRVGPRRVLPAAYVGAALFTAAVGVSGSLLFVMLAVFAAGFCVIGAQISLNAVAANVYPTAIRSTGIGWAFGAGRVGSIIGPIVGGIMISLEIDTVFLFIASGIPALIAAAAVLVLVRTPEAPVALRSVSELGDA